MLYREFIPSAPLRAYVKCFYSFESGDAASFEDIVFPGGHPEMIFNLGEGSWQTDNGAGFSTTPPVEVWGKLTQPLAVRSVGLNTMLGVKFHGHTVGCFIGEAITSLNNKVADGSDLFDSSLRSLYGQLLGTVSMSARIALLESFLLKRLSVKSNLSLVGQVIRDMQESDEPDALYAIADRYRISPRYLNKLFQQYTGVSPKLYNKIDRFQNSLQLIADKQSSLTSIAYDCGYFDQSHFIRDFKSFTGFPPSAYAVNAYPVTQAMSSN